MPLKSRGNMKTSVSFISYVHASEHSATVTANTSSAKRRIPPAQTGAHTSPHPPNHTPTAHDWESVKWRRSAAPTMLSRAASWAPAEGKKRNEQTNILGGRIVAARRLFLSRAGATPARREAKSNVCTFLIRRSTDFFSFFGNRRSASQRKRSRRLKTSILKMPQMCQLGSSVEMNQNIPGSILLRRDEMCCCKLLFKALHRVHKEHCHRSSVLKKIRRQMLGCWSQNILNLFTVNQLSPPRMHIFFLPLS